MSLKTKTFLSVVLLGTILGLCGPHLLAQQSAGSISGIVQDPQKMLVTGAKVTLMNEAQGAASAREVMTSMAGTFLFTPVQPGSYTITVEAAGFKKYETSGISLSATDKLGLPPIILEIGAVTDVITVQAAAVQLQTESAERSGTLSANQVSNLAVIGRNFNALLTIIPGVAPDTGDQTSVINGARSGMQQFAVDGVTVMDTSCNCGSLWRFNTDIISEFKVLANSQSAEFGRAAGGNISMVTKSGSRDFHGAFYAFLRNDWMNANDFVNNFYGRAKPFGRYRTLGGSFGGPIYWPGKFNSNKDKLFFFANIEVHSDFTPSYDGSTKNAITVPTELERKGDFSQSHYGDGSAVTVIDPLTHQPFPGNVIPPSRISPDGQSLLNWFPLPNLAGVDPSFNYQTSTVMHQPIRDQMYRFDYNINPKWRTYFRVLTNKNKIDARLGLPYNPNNLGFVKLFNNTNAVSYMGNVTTIINPKLTNEFSYGYSHKELPTYPQPDSLVIKANVDVDLPLLYPDADPFGYVPGFTFNGVPNAPRANANQMPYRNIDNVGDWTDNITGIVGNHIIKAGLFIENSSYSETAVVPNGGSYSFDVDSSNPGDTRWPFATALLGNFTTFQQANVGLTGHYRYHIFEWFLQDDWKVRPNLTVNYGMRFSLLPPTFEENNQVSLFSPDAFDRSSQVSLYQKAINPATGKVAALNPITGEYLDRYYIGAIVSGSGSLSNGMLVGGTGDTPKGLIDSRGVQYGPRLGIAWSPGGAGGKTVIRMGAGIFYQRLGMTLLSSLIKNPPVTRVSQLYYSSFSALSSGDPLNFPFAAATLAKDGHIPTVYNYNLGVQRELPFNVLFDVAYVGSVSKHLAQSIPLNDPAFGTAWLPENQDPTVPPKFDGTTTLPVNFLRPYPGYGSLPLNFYSGIANYNSLQVSANRRFSNKLAFGVAYTWSKALGTSSGDTNNVNPLNWRVANYGPMSFDRTQALVANYVFGLPSPFRPGSRADNIITRAVFSGWEISGITTLSSGTPTNFSFSINNVSGAALNRQITGTETEAPRVVLSGNPNLSPGDRTLYAWIDTSAIHPATKGSTGMDSGMNSLRGPGTNNWDMTLSKKFFLGKSEVRYLQIRLETYNTFNHTQWRGVNLNANFDSTGAITNLPTDVGGKGGRFGFGALNSVRDPRRVQFSARINF